MKIVLIHPYHSNTTDDRLDPPLGLLYLSSHLKKFGIYDVEIIDLSGGKNLKIPKADFYGITSYITSLDLIRDIFKKCKETNDKSKVIIGGAHATAMPEHFYYSDHIVKGYGEQALIDIITGKNTNKIVLNNNIDDLFIFPDYNNVSLESYNRVIFNRISVPYLTSRGCPFNCVFCGLANIHDLNKHVKMASPETVYSHIKKLVNEYGIKSINFQDDIFTLNPKRLYKILKLLSTLDIKFRCMGRAGYDTEETYKMLSDYGCEQVSWGIESGSQYILDRMNKQVKVEDNYNVIQWAKKYNINSRIFIIIGFPGETAETLEETKQFIEFSNPDQVFVSNFIPYPGTKPFIYPKRYGITNISYDFSQYYQVSKSILGGFVIDTEWLSREEFRKLEIEFKTFILNRGIRGETQKYEKVIYGENKYNNTNNN